MGTAHYPVPRIESMYSLHGVQGMGTRGIIIVEQVDGSSRPLRPLRVTIVGPGGNACDAISVLQ